MTEYQHLDSKYDFSGHDGTLIKTNHYDPKTDNREIVVNEYPNHVWISTRKNITQDHKDFSNEEDHYKKKKSYPCNTFDEEQKEIPSSETIFMTLQVEEFDLTEPMIQVPKRVWKKVIRDFSIRKAMYFHGHYDTQISNDNKLLRVQCGRRLYFVDSESMTDICELEKERWGQQKWLSKRLFLAQFSEQKQGSMQWMLYDLQEKKLIGEPRKDDGFKTEPGYKYYDNTAFQFKESPDKIHFFVKKKGNTTLTLAFIEVEKGLNQPFTHVPESEFAIESKGIEIGELQFLQQSSCFFGWQNNETIFVMLKENKIVKINRQKDKQYFRFLRRGVFVYQDTEDEKYKYFDCKDFEVKEIEDEEGKRFEDFNEKTDQADYNIKTKMLTGRPKSKFKEDLQPLEARFVFVRELPEQKMEQTLCVDYGKTEIFTSRVLAHQHWAGLIYLYDMFTKRTFYLDLDVGTKFIGFFNQVEEDPRKISYIHIDDKKDIWVSHIWLSEIDKCHLKSIEKIERKAVHLKGITLPANSNRVYWESKDGFEGVVVQTPLNITLWMREDETDEFKSVVQEESLPIQLVRPLFETKLRWMYVQKNESDSVLKYLTLGERSSKIACTYEDTTLWAISFGINNHWGGDTGQGFLSTIDNRRKITNHWVHYDKNSQDIMVNNQKDADKFYITQYAHDELQKFKHQIQFVGFQFDFTYSPGPPTFNFGGAQFKAFWAEDKSLAYNEQEEYLSMVHVKKLGQDFRNVSMSDNNHTTGELMAFRNIQHGDYHSMTVQRTFDSHKYLLPFKTKNAFYHYDEENIGLLKNIIFFIDDRKAIMMTPELEVVSDFDTSEILQDEKIADLVLELGLGDSEDHWDKTARISEMFSSPKNNWHVFIVQVGGQTQFYMRAKFDPCEGFSHVQQIQELLDNKQDQYQFKEISDDGTIILARKTLVKFIGQDQKNLNEMDFESDQQNQFEEVTWLEVLQKGRILLVFDSKFSLIFDTTNDEIKRLSWNNKDKQENEFIQKRFEITQAKPLNDKEECLRIGFTLKNTRDDSVLIVIWDMEINSEVCSHYEKEEVRLYRTPTSLLYFRQDMLKNALTGVPQILAQHLIDHLNVFENKRFLLADNQQNLIFLTNHSFKKRDTMIFYPNCPYHAVVQDALVNRTKNYVLGKRCFFMYKDPETGEGVFSAIKFRADILDELQKSIELAYEAHEEGVKDFFTMILEPSWKAPDKPSLFQKAIKVSQNFTDLYLKLLTDSEQEYNTNSIVIPSCANLEKLIECPNIQNYLEACKRPVEPDSSYKTTWNHKEDRLTFLRPFSYCTLEFKASQLGQPTDPKMKKEIESFKSGGMIRSQSTKVIGEVEEIEEEQTVFLDSVSFEFLHRENGVRDYCEMMSKVKDEKVLGLKVTGVVVNLIWSYAFPKIIKLVFIPYMIYFSTFISYISIFYDPEDNSENYLKFLFLPLCLLYSTLQLLFEVGQMKEQGIDYITSASSIWNVFDLTSSTFVILFGVVDLFNWDTGNQIYVLGCLAVFILWLKLFYFMRLFAPTSSFIRMIVEMFMDIRVFMLIFFCGIFAFANSILVLDYSTAYAINEATGQEEEIANATGVTLMSAIHYIYTQSLGDYNFDMFDVHPQGWLYWAFFYLSTIFIQITLLNLIIAIMGDSFERIVEVKTEAQLKEVCSFVSEYFMYFPKEVFSQSSLILIAGLEGSDGKKGASWEGKLGAIKSHFRMHIGNVENKLMKMNESLHVDLDKQNKMSQESKSQLEIMEQTIKVIKQTQAKLEIKIKEDFTGINEDIANINAES